MESAPEAAYNCVTAMMAYNSMHLAEARLAADYLVRAEAWVGDIDRQLGADIERIHERLVARIAELLDVRDGRPT